MPKTIMAPKFSVVIPLYNKVSHIARAINSVLAQTVSDFELLVVNDGSTDGSEYIVEKYKDARVKLINKSNGGEADARNRGIIESGGSYIAFLDADDSWDNNFLEIIEDLILNYPAVGGYAVQVRNSRELKEGNLFVSSDGLNENSWVLDNYFKSVLSGYYPVTSSSVCIKRSVFQDVGNFYEGLPIGADIDMWVRISLRYKFAISNSCAATYFTDAENRSVERKDFTQQELVLFLRLRDKYLTPDLDVSSYKALSDWIDNRIHQIIVRLIFKGNKKSAAAVYFKNFSSLNYRHKFNISLRLVTPNYVIDKIKQMRAALV